MVLVSNFKKIPRTVSRQACDMGLLPATGLYPVIRPLVLLWVITLMAAVVDSVALQVTNNGVRFGAVVPPLFAVPNVMVSVTMICNVNFFSPATSPSPNSYLLNLVERKLGPNTGMPLVDPQLSSPTTTAKSLYCPYVSLYFIPIICTKLKNYP